jgi:DNA-directed RNA polymerase subunit omega
LLINYKKDFKMARITSQEATQAIGNQYDVILIAARRARELKRGWHPTVQCKNDVLVTAIREIEAGNIGRDYLLKPRTLDRKERPPEDSNK